MCMYLKGEGQYFSAVRLLPSKKTSWPPGCPGLEALAAGTSHKTARWGRDGPAGLYGLAVSFAVTVQEVAVGFPSYVATVSLLSKCLMECLPGAASCL